jgi:ABC-type lipoprotein export system ATPase subunit
LEKIILKNKTTLKNNNMHPLILLNKISIAYPDGEQRTEVLRELSLSVLHGDVVAITGPSGSGKSTLLSIIGTLLKPDSGEYFFDGQNILSTDSSTNLSTNSSTDLSTNLSTNYTNYTNENHSSTNDGTNSYNSCNSWTKSKKISWTKSEKNSWKKNLAGIRNRSIGFIFQDHRLLPQFTARENILLPALAGQKRTTGEQEERADYLLQMTGIASHAHKYPEQLSGGECQRVAICRALIMNPKLLLADEPTGLLDAVNAGKISDLLLAVNASEKCTILMVTHSGNIANKARQIYQLQNGILSNN